MTKETTTKIVRRDMKLVYVIAVAVVGIVSPIFLLKSTQAMHGQAIENLKETTTLHQQAIDTLERTTTTLQAISNIYHGTK